MIVNTVAILHDTLHLYNIPEWSLSSARQLDRLRDLGMEKMKIVDLGESGGVVDTRLRSLLLKVAEGLDCVLRGAQVGVNGVSAASGSGVLQLDILARTGNLGDVSQLFLYLGKLDIEELLNSEIQKWDVIV